MWNVTHMTCSWQVSHICVLQWRDSSTHFLCCVCIVWRPAVAGCRPWWGYNDSNVCVSGRPLCLTPRLISPWFRTAAPAVLCALASAPSSTASRWLPGRPLTCQSEASLKPWSPCAERNPRQKKTKKIKMSTSQHRIYSVIAVWRINFVVEGGKQIIRFKKNNCLIFTSQLSRNNLRGCKAWCYFETIASRFVEVKFLPRVLRGLMGMNPSGGNSGCLCRCGKTTRIL